MKRTVIAVLLTASLSGTAQAGWISEGIIHGAIMEEIGIDQHWEHYHILIDCMKRIPNRDYDAEVHSKLSKKQLERLKQLTTQLYIKTSRFNDVCRMLDFTSEQIEEAKGYAKAIKPKIKPKQLEMVFKLRSEHFSLFMTDEEIATLCGDKLHQPVIRLYTGRSTEGDRHAIGIDWMRCLADGRVAAAMKLTIGQRKKLTAFRRSPRVKDFLKNEKRLFREAEEEWLTNSTLGRFRKHMLIMGKTPEYLTMTKVEKREARKKAWRKFVGGDETLDQVVAREKVTYFKTVDEQATFVVEFLESLLSDDELIEIKQRVLQSGMVLGSAGLQPAFRQVGIDKNRDVEAYGKFVPYSGDDYLEPMADYVQWCAYRDIFGTVMGHSRFDERTGERITFPSPFNSKPSKFVTELYDEKITFIDKPKNPRRAR